MLPSRIRERLVTRQFGRRIYYCPETDSTNRVAMALARAGETSGTMVLADFQTHGKGRLDRTWVSRPGEDLLFTLVLRPDGPPGPVLPVTLVFSAAISASLSGRLGVDVGVKWPNDMMVGGEKIGGILAEGAAVPGGQTYVVVGVGVNVNSTRGNFPDEVGERAVSCRSLTRRKWDRAAILADMLLSMEDDWDRFRRDGFGALREEYERNLVLRGKRVSFDSGGERVTAMVDGVEDDGALRVCGENDDRKRSLYGEEVRLEP